VLSDGTVVEMEEGGRNTPLVYSHRQQFCEWVQAVRLGESDAQVRAVLDGIADVVPLEPLQLMRWSELEAAVCGVVTVDVDLLARHTQYPSGVDANTPYIRYFWNVMRRFSQVRSAFALVCVCVCVCICVCVCVCVCDAFCGCGCVGVGDDP
jgi:E3 ubiquitin-protein ligase HECTD3